MPFANPRVVALCALMTTFLLDEAPSQAQPERLRAVVAPAALARLTHAGLDPNAADFAAQVRRRLSTSFHVSAGHVREPFAAFRMQANAARDSLNSFKPPVPQKTAGSQSITARNGRSVAAIIGRSNEFVWAGIYSFQNSGAVSTLTVPGLNVAVLQSQNESLPQQLRAADLEYVVPDCSVDIHASADVYRWDEHGALLAGLTRVAPAAGTYYVIFNTLNSPWPLLPIGAHSHPGTLTVRDAGVASPARSVQYAPVSETTTLGPITVDFTAPYLADNALGLSVMNSNVAQSGVDRLNLGSTEMSGDDYLGQKIQTAPGYSVTASITAARSISDIGDTSPDNAYRGASVRAQPTGNRLETIVHWHLAPGESLQYQVQWDAFGPVGQRPLLSMPKAGPCDS